MLHDLTQRFNRWRFYRAARGITAVDPIHARDDAVRIVSSVSHLDLYMYLVALKTFQRFVPRGRPWILDDGSLSPDDIAVLRDHANPAEIVRLDDVAYGGGTKGVRWGILLTMADLAQDNYVLQLDSDTVTVADLPHVEEAIRRQRSFTLGTAMGTEIVPARRASDNVRDIVSNHVQVVAEQAFERLSDVDRLKYVRGNSGLVGIGKGAISRASVEHFLQEMSSVLGQKWRERGSFQVASNFTVANAADAFVLPLDEYRYYTPGADLGGARFIHFIGNSRFADDSYLKVAQSAVRGLMGVGTR